MEIVGIFHGHLVYLTAIWYICGNFGIFLPIWYVVPRTIWQPWLLAPVVLLAATTDKTRAPA
jgi:hypothetical protein